MQNSSKHRTGNAIMRMIFVGISILLQIAYLLLIILRLNTHYTLISAITAVLTFVVVLRLYTTHTNTALKLPWIMLLLIFPVMGLSLYLLTVLLGDLGSAKKRLAQQRETVRPCLPANPEIAHQLTASPLPGVTQCRYLQETGGWPAYANTAVTYHAMAAEALEDLKADLEAAEHFIFMEYFIVANCSAFRELADILIGKAKQGVDVRLMYDDIGSTGYVNLFFAKTLSDAGIRCQAFNPALPVLNLFMNHRDHRKITVIDGKVGYTGGYNLSDEYFGREAPFGIWKDTGIRMEGEAVASLTAAFLEMWNAAGKTREDPGSFLSLRHSVPGASGFVQPYADAPQGRERITEKTYLHLICSSKKSLYITTPYLIITDEMANALGHAARRGVDVRIITPGIPDKKTVYALTRSFYSGLAAQGVRIFEYTPGFCHNKQMLCDGAVASIGTSNLDYRSLYTHFENNVLLYGGDAVTAMAQDFDRTFPLCREVTEQYRTGRGAILKIWQCFLRLFAPLM